MFHKVSWDGETENQIASNCGNDKMKDGNDKMKDGNDKMKDRNGILNFQNVTVSR